MLPGLSAGTPENVDIGGSLSDFITNLTYYYARKKNKANSASPAPGGGWWDDMSGILGAGGSI
jgi:hypothetical protein